MKITDAKSERINEDRSFLDDISVQESFLSVSIRKRLSVCFCLMCARIFECICVHKNVCVCVWVSVYESNVNKNLWLLFSHISCCQYLKHYFSHDATAIRRATATTFIYYMTTLSTHRQYWTERQTDNQMSMRFMAQCWRHQK